MTLGSEVRFNYQNPVARLFFMLFGVMDLHSHIRWNAIKEYMDNHCEKNVEVGGGWGVMSMEFAKKSHKAIDCIEIDSQSVALGEFLAAKSELKVKFLKDFLPNLSELGENDYHQVFLIDVLEHVQADLESLIRINKLLIMNGKLVISVPTPIYPKVFGYEMTKKVGHVRDGYTITDLKELLDNSGFNILDWKYHTNRIASFLCRLWYKNNYPSAVRIVLFPICKAIATLDSIDRKKNSCGIAVKAIKVTDM